ncbi:holo-ACP synthase [Ornithinibacillus gellani]|uniref:holo-ACP synthase n=1 Tax=Ornithinibacillus gellani TaxID=2293253 RepID=UPI000F465C75|nr:holo-ACP synthase [Ornithinibacillus gellani]TQS76419.1 holo-ACP synthase [Ornithinibacillus gellani]
MIKGIGIDIIEIDRITESVKKNQRFPSRILTEKEQEQYAICGTEKRQMEFLAGRFAAKEAFAKATGTGIGQLSFQDIEVMPDANGAPTLKVAGYEAHQLFISISHSKAYAVAQVIIETKE